MYCPSCGKTLKDDAIFCDGCGAKVSKTHNDDVSEKSAIFGKEEPYLPPVSYEEHSLISCIILSLLPVFGLFYQYFWIVRLTNDANTLSKKEKNMSGILTLLLIFLTCGIFSIIWILRIGAIIDDAKHRYKIDRGSSSAALYVVALLLGLVLVPLAMMQNDLNKIASK